ncbi:hypothetical protein ACQKL6_00965 [Peribacillus sp. NPDC097197]|uniref:hypothetical protein n=1 Tax=Peribacillus sp. NPDC097197 TaxID=3390615 RepID=UPI003D02F1EF
MGNYHKITINGVTFFREFNSASGYYGLDELTKEELVEQIMDEVIESSVEIDEEEINQAIRSIPSYSQRESVQNYITYLEMVAESLE